MAWSAPYFRRLALSVLALAIAATAFGLYITHPAPHRSVASGAAGTAPTGGGRPQVRAPQAVAKSEPKGILFVGASYTAGVGAQPQTNGYAYLTARALGWQPRIDAVPGSGYLNPGPPSDRWPSDRGPNDRGQGGTFADRLAKMPTSPAPDLVVLQGGRNDIGYPEAELHNAVQHTVDVARARFSHARIVLLGPIPAALPPSHGEFAVAHVLRDVARSADVSFVDPIAEGWITNENERGYVGDVPAHPDNAGYAYIAKRLVDDLDKLLGATSQTVVLTNH
jgi:lysophospholipase L1-like esterase